MLLWLSTPTLLWSGHNLKAGPLRNQFRQAASCRPNRILSILLVLMMAGIVQFAFSKDGFAEDKSAQARTETKPNPITDAKAAIGPDGNSGVKTEGTFIPLPKNVAYMRDALLAATQSAKIEELRTPYEWNELPPTISDEKIDDPIAYWKRISRDQQGLEILLIIDKLLKLPPTKLNVGSDVENSALYVWPYLSELDLSNLTPRQEFELRTLVPPKEARKIMDSKKWTWWRLAIGADGTWHSFMKHDR